MRTITAQALTAEGFAPFGDYWSQQAPEVKHGRGYAFESWVYPEFVDEGEVPSLGLTVGEALSVPTTRMERHFRTTETLFSLAAPVVLAVAPMGGEAPDAEDVQAFLLMPGDVVRLKRGVWHDACRGVRDSVLYGWLADCRGPLDPWLDVLGGPVIIEVPGQPG